MGKRKKPSTINKDIKNPVCRVCLCSTTDKFVSVFQPYKSSTVSFHINAITSIEIREGDGLPDKICPTCLLELETVVSFKTKCENSNEILQSTSSIFQKVGNTASNIQQQNFVEVKKEEEDYEDFNSLFDTSLQAEEIYEPLDNGVKVEIPRINDGKLQCNECGEIFKSKCKLRVHWKKIHLPNALKCNKCLRVFKSSKAYNNHMVSKRQSCIEAEGCRIEGEGRSRIFHCLDCDYQTLRIKDMATHKVTHSGERPFKCDICSKAYSQLSALFSHKESYHKEFKVQMTCHVCGKEVKGRHKVYKHLLTHRNLRYQCDICNTTLKSRQSMIVHMSRHSGVKNYTCEQCAASFFSTSELCNHKRNVHQPPRSWFECDICLYKTHRKYNMKQHKAKHTGNNIACPKCGMFFENELNMTKHFKVHVGERKHACPLCDKKFFRSDTVTKHVKAKHNSTMSSIGVKNNNQVTQYIIVNVEPKENSFFKEEKPTVLKTDSISS